MTGRVRVEIGADDDAGFLQLMIEQRERLLNRLVEIDGAERRGGSAREVEQRIDDLARAEGLLGDLIEDLRFRGVFGHLLGQHLRVGGDDGERRVDFMRHAGGKQADAAEFVGLNKALFEFGAIGNIVEDDQAADLLLVLRYQRGDGEVERGLAGWRRVQCPMEWPLAWPFPLAGAAPLAEACAGQEACAAATRLAPL